MLVSRNTLVADGCSAQALGDTYTVNTNVGGVSMRLEEIDGSQDAANGRVKALKDEAKRAKDRAKQVKARADMAAATVALQKTSRSATVTAPSAGPVYSA